MIKPELIVPLENVKGALAELTDILDQNEVNIETIFATAYNQIGFARFVVDQPNSAQKVLKAKGVSTKGEVFVRPIVNPAIAPGSIAHFVDKITGYGIDMYSLYNVPSGKYVGVIVSTDPMYFEAVQDIVQAHYTVQYFPSVITMYVSNDVGGLNYVIHELDNEDVQLITMAVTEVDRGTAIGKVIAANPDNAISILSDLGCLPNTSVELIERPGWHILLENRFGALHDVLVDFDEHEVNIDCVFIAHPLDTSDKKKRSLKQIMVTVNDASLASDAVNGW